MKTLLITLLLLISSSAMAKTAWFYDIDRSGEGIVLSEIDDGRLAFAFYSHTAHATGAPTPSPAPPPPKYCDKDTVWFIGISELYAEGIALGDVYYDVAVKGFPEAEDGAVSHSVKVGEFVIEKEGDGFYLYMESNNIMCKLTVFDTPHYFTTKLTE